MINKELSWADFKALVSGDALGDPGQMEAIYQRITDKDPAKEGVTAKEVYVTVMKAAASVTANAKESL